MCALKTLKGVLGGKKSLYGQWMSWVCVYTPTANPWCCLELRANRAAIRGGSRNIFLAPLSLCMSGMWAQLNPCWACCPLSQGCKSQFAHEPLTSSPWADRKDKKEKGMKGFDKYSKSNSFNRILCRIYSKLGLKTLPEGRGLCYTWTLLGLRQWMNHPGNLKSWLVKHTSHPFPQTAQRFRADHFHFVLSAEGERMQWGWNAGGLLSLLVNICLRAK